MRTIVYLSLGSNRGSRQSNLEQALSHISSSGIDIQKLSAVYETAPQDVTAQPWFLNMVVEAETGLTAESVLDSVQRIERELGRDRTAELRFGPRIIDIDLLLYGSEEIETATLIVPHPRMRQRRFVLEPLAEIAPDLVDPTTGTRFRDFWAGVSGQATRIAIRL